MAGTPYSPRIRTRATGWDNGGRERAGATGRDRGGREEEGLLVGIGEGGKSRGYW